jgi:hypothetical protein
MAENIKDAHKHKKKEKGGKKRVATVINLSHQQHRDAPLTSSP